MDKRGEEGGREYHDFPLKICCLTVPKKFVGEPFSVSENFWCRKMLAIKRVGGGGGVSQFPVEFVLSHSTEKILGGTLRCFRKFRVSKNSMHRRGISRFSVGNFFSHSTEKLRRRTLPGFRKILVSNFSYIRGGRVSRFSIVIIKFKKCKLRLGFEPVPTASKPCCRTHCAMGTIRISDKSQ